MEINKDFYDDLPSSICIILDTIIKEYKDKDWFPKAWEEYRQHIKESDMDTMKMPGFIFNKYTKNDEVNHSGILGMKWGVRRYQNEDGSLTEEGKKHYQKLDDKWISKQSDKIYEKASKESSKEMNEFYKAMVAAGEHGASARNKYNQKLAEVMRSKTSDIRSPSGKVVQWVAKRGSIGVYMALADPGYDMSQVSKGVWDTGRVAYKTKTVETYKKEEGK